MSRSSVSALAARVATAVFAATLVGYNTPLPATGPGFHGPEAALFADSQTGAAAETGPAWHQLWAISSRHAASDETGSRLEYWRHDAAADRWDAASHEEFLAEDRPEAITCFFVHGNRFRHHEALGEGQLAWRKLSECVPPEQPLRFVIWSWPSAQIEGPLRDVRYKACVSDVHAWHLAWLVDHMHPEAPISLIGHSFGARLVSGSLHLLGGGRLTDRALSQRCHPSRQPLHVVLMAGALDSHALLPRGRNHRALSQVEQMLILVNPRDPVLHHYPLLAGLFPAGPPALGYTGFFKSSLGHEQSKVTLRNVSDQVGGEHDWQHYLNPPVIRSWIRHFALVPE